jgi:hypothetical protein
MKHLDPSWKYDNSSLRNISMVQLKANVYNNPEIYLHHLPDSSSVSNFDPAFIDLLWNTIRGKYENSGQYADYELIIATVLAANLDIQLHGISDTLLTIEGRTVTNKIHLLYCGISIGGHRGNHYDALLPKPRSSNTPTNAQFIDNTDEVTQTQTTDDADEVTQTQTTDDADIHIPLSQNTLTDNGDAASLPSSHNESTIYTETLLSKYLDHILLKPHRKKVVQFLNNQNNSSTHSVLHKKRKTCSLCFCRYRALHLHGKSTNSVARCNLFQSIRAQLLPLHLSSVDGPDVSSTISPGNDTLSSCQ